MRINTNTRSGAMNATSIFQLTHSTPQACFSLNLSLCQKDEGGLNLQVHGFWLDKRLDSNPASPSCFPSVSGPYVEVCSHKLEFLVSVLLCRAVVAGKDSFKHFAQLKTKDYLVPSLIDVFSPFTNQISIPTLRSDLTRFYSSGKKSPTPEIAEIYFPSIAWIIEEIRLAQAISHKADGS